MSSAIPIFQINPALDRHRLKRGFVAENRLQIRDFLTAEAARAIYAILATQTPWGLAWKGAGDGPPRLRWEQLSALRHAEKERIGAEVTAAMRGSDYGFVYAHYPMLDAYLQNWSEGSPHDMLIEHVNDQPFLDLVREVTGIPELIKADAQATLYAPNQFLALHDDSHVAEGWRIAYVLNFCAEDWRPDWGGYLMFYDEDGDVVAGFKPRFNALNLFRVPQKHNVTYVPPFAPVGRFAISGWFRDR
ncbi:MAG: 2OG-Fe(II) oxygenase [Pseudomonadota bacterium]|nr:2OG-Fe(II) oxygenase [Pseudomonadota bacterium]